MWIKGCFETMTRYIRPLVQTGPARPRDAHKLAGGWCWFTHVEILSRTAAPSVVPVTSIEAGELAALVTERPAIAGLSFDGPRLMGILNVTPDSFSDGGRHQTLSGAVEESVRMVSKGADLIDIGGESTRPGAVAVAPEDEMQRTAPVIQAIRGAGVATPISIDTRKSAVGRAAICAGANIVNDVSGFTYDLELAAICGKLGTPVCVMHAQGDPVTMQDEPQYDDVLLDVYDFLGTQIDVLRSLGIQRSSIIADPGIGFGKSQSHNLKLLNRISLFHSLGVPILLGASRKRFIGNIGDEPVADKRAAGSVGVALAAIGQGVQLIRAHDIVEHQQAIALWQASVTQDLNEVE